MITNQLMEVKGMRALSRCFLLIVLCGFLMVLGCGGGGGGDSSNPPPAPPGGVFATNGAGLVTVNWTDVPEATSYNLYYSTSNGFDKTTGTKLTGVSSPSPVDNLIRGTTYHFAVTAVNSYGESALSNKVSGIPDPPNPTFSTSDLSGEWFVQVILAGDSPGWYTYTADVDGGGVVTVTPYDNSGVIPPSVTGWSIVPGMGLDNTAGVVEESGGGANTTFRGKMASSKTLIVGTSTSAVDNTYALHVMLKRTGKTYSDSDLQNIIFGYNRIYTGDWKFWEFATGSVDDSNQVTLDKLERNSGDQLLPGVTTVQVDPEGFVNIVNEPDFLGMMSDDKKIIVGTSTDGIGRYSMRIIQLRGQTYTADDIAGLYQANSFHSDSQSSWAYATWTLNKTSPTTADAAATNIENSDGSFVPGPITWSYSIDSSGKILDPGKASTRGLVSFGKDLVVTTSDFPFQGDVTSTITLKVQ